MFMVKKNLRSTKGVKFRQKSLSLSANLSDFLEVTTVVGSLCTIQKCFKNLHTLDI